MKADSTAPAAAGLERRGSAPADGASVGCDPASSSDAEPASVGPGPAGPDVPGPRSAGTGTAGTGTGAVDAGAALFQDRLPLALRFAEHLTSTGVERGLIGPREAPKVWERHVLNCAVVAELVPDGARVVDVGSGAGLPGIPLVLARPDLQVVLVEPLARRVDWLREVLADLQLPIEVQRGRAEDVAVRRRWKGADVVTARAVAPLHRLAGWSLPLLRTGGQLLAVKGSSAAAEIERDASIVRQLGGGPARITQCGVGLVDPPCTVVVVLRTAAPRAGRGRPGRGQA